MPRECCEAQARLPERASWCCQGRRMLFISTSCHVLQSAIRSKEDLQLRHRLQVRRQSNPEDDTGDNTHYPPVPGEGPIRKATYSFRCGCCISRHQDHSQTQQIQIVAIIATAMRAANVADFYLTKYQWKAQEILAMRAANVTDFYLTMYQSKAKNYLSGLHVLPTKLTNPKEDMSAEKEESTRRREGVS